MDTSTDLIKDKERTLGDGIDNSLLNPKENKKISPSINVNISKPFNPSFKPIEPNSKIVTLIPKYIPKERKMPKYLTRKHKEPKFVPYEPYKCAIEPIIPIKHNQFQTRTSRNNIEIQQLVTQISELRTSELKCSEDKENDEGFITKKQWNKEKAAYETDIKNLRESNSHLENQLKFQAQVNSELKTLLVAAVGEDLESRVQHLTEDKLQLARALLNSANHLTSHQEQTEWLSGQCEVWRSKFLASSLMVEELARWKSALSIRITELQETIRKLLEELKAIGAKSLRTHYNLSNSIKKLQPEYQLAKMKNYNVIELSNNNLQQSETINNLLNINNDKDNNDNLASNKLPHYTSTELCALKLLQDPVFISTKQDAICNALMGAAMSLSGEQKYLQNPINHYCAHCKGEVKNI